MISFELAKQLKKVGFDQKINIIQWELEKKPMYDIGYHLTADDLNMDEYGHLINKARLTSIYSPEWINSEDGLFHTVYIPTLSELIEACEEKIDFALFRWGNTWVCGDRTEYEQDWITRAEGQILEEAVANLWLKLNKK